MPEQRSWCCGFIPRFWWWFLALLGLPLLFLLMTYFRQGVIEGDLTTRVGEKLTGEGIDWVDVNVDRRGRDVLLKGIAPNEEERDRALELAQGVYGVNRVDFDIDSAVDDSTAGNTETVEEAASVMPALAVKLSDGKLTLEGQLASQDEIDALVKAAGDRFGAENVTNQLIVGKGIDSPEWLSSSDELFGVMPDKEAALNVSEQGMEIVGTVNSESAKQAMVTRAKSLLGDNLVDKIEVKTLLPAEVEMSMADDKLTLQGKVSSQSQVDTLLKVAGERVGQANVINQLEVSDEHADAAWMDSVQQLVAGLLVDNGTAKIADGTLRIDAEVESDDARNELVSKSKQALKDSGLTLVHNIVVKLSAADLAAEACQKKLDAALNGKKVLFQVNKADIRSESNALLDELAGIIVDCKANLEGKRVAIGGHTDSDGPDDYNLSLSESRAQAVGDYLKGKGVSAGLIETKGFGETQAVASNDTAEGKAQNRRISFEIKSAE